MLSNSNSRVTQFGRDVFYFLYIIGFSLLMFYLFRILKFMFMSEIDLLFSFLILFMPGFGIKVMLLSELRSFPSFTIPWNNL